MKRSKLKLFSIILFTLMSFGFLTISAKAEGEHRFSFKAYRCGVYDPMDGCLGPNNDYETPEITLGDGNTIDPAVVNAGEVIKLAVYYKPGADTYWIFSTFVNYEPDYVSAIHDDEFDELILDKTGTVNDTTNPGPYPAKSTRYPLETNWVVQYNDAIQSHNIDVVIKDNAGSAAQRKYMEDEGILYYVYFKVKDDVEPGTVITFSYNMDPGKTKIANNAPVIAEIGTLQVYKELDTDTSLSGIEVKNGTTNYLTNFDKDTKTYNVYVPNGVENVTVTGTPTKDTTSAATVPSGEQNLSVSTNKQFVITTTAESGDTDTYTVNVYRLDNNANLTALGLGSGITLTPTFASGTTSYTATVPYATSSVNVTATKESSKATVSGTGSKNLTAGEVTNINVVVTPENCGSAYASVPGNTCTTKTYTIAVTREAADTNAYLSDLKINGTTVPGFDKETFTYTIDDVSNSTTSVTVTPTKESSLSTLSGDTSSKTLSVGDNQIKVTVTAEDGTTKNTYTVNVKRKSNDANLATLSVTSTPSGTLSPSTFSPSTTTYTYTVGPDVTEVEISATASDPGASVAGTGTYNPNTDTEAQIIVTPEDGEAKVYTVNLVRTKSTDVTLDELSVTGYTISPNYSDSVNSYSVTVPSDVNSVSVVATPHDSRTTATVSGPTSDLQIGDNTVTVTVTPENGSSSARTITINVKRLDNNASLESLTLDGVTLSPAFNANTTEYTATVPYTKTSTTISATPVSGATIVATSDLGAKELVVGNTNTFTITVMAEDGVTTKDYVVTVTRLAASGNAYLTDLKVDGTTVPSFDGENVFTYTLDDASSSKDKITISATPNENSTIRVGDTGEKTLNIGDNSFEVVVIAQNGETRVPYTINIKRLDNNNKLSSLTITSNPQGSLDNSFDPDTDTYIYTVGPDVTEVVIGATSTDGTTVTGTGTFDPNDTNTVTITVTPEDPSAEAKTYTINLVREESTNNKLSDLTIDGTTVDGFDPDTTTYNVTVPSDKDTITVGATAEDTLHANVSGTGDKPLQTGNNPIVVTVTAEDGTPKEYIVNVYKENDDNTLSNLTLDNVTLDQTFDPNVTEYTAIVPYTTDTTTVNATPNDTNANALVTGNTDLSVGENTFTIVVTPEDENATPKTYTVTVTRLDVSTDAYLTDLKVNGTSVPGFNKDIRTYNIEVGNSIASAEIAATANELSTVSGDIGTKQLNVGTNTFVVSAVAQDGNTTTPYTVNIKRLDSNNNLEDLTITSDPAGSLDKRFDPDTTEYTYTVGPNTGDITVTADPEGSATVEGEGTYDPKTTDTITITVTPEDGEPKEYVIHVNREKSTNNDLLSLGVEGYSITPTFDKDVTEYTLTVPRDVDKATITAEKADSNATINASDLGEKDLNPGANTFTVTVTPEDPNASSKTYTIVITRTQGTDGTLSSITVDGEPITGFDPSILEYTLPDLPSSAETITIGATPTDDNAQVSGDGVITLTPGENRIPITVTPEDPNAEPVTYTLIVNKELDDNIYLKNLTVNGTSVPEFNKETNNYSVNVPADATTVAIAAEPEANTSTVSGTGAAIALTGDSTEITITVTSQKGTNNPYKVTINKVDDAEYITSVAYGHTIEDGMIKTVAYKTKSNELKDQLDNDNSLLFMYKADDSDIYSNDEPLATGVIVKLIRNNNLKDSKLVVVKGDVDGNGRITLFDAVKVLNHFLEKETLEGIYFEAADVDSNGSITLFDAVGILRIFLNDNE